MFGVLLFPVGEQMHFKSKQRHVKSWWREDRLRDARLVRLDGFSMRGQSLMKEAPK